MGGALIDVTSVSDDCNHIHEYFEEDKDVLEAEDDSLASQRFWVEVRF